ncbi:MAG: PAS domain S-box protein, partial [candidate division KSB1 bacterium]|nr:PAS domain S-box protein [candidate division KSB1 bacterium]
SEITRIEALVKKTRLEAQTAARALAQQRIEETGRLQLPVLLDEAELQKNRELRQALLKGEIPEFEMEKRFVSKSGKVLCVILRVTLVCDSQSTPLYYIGQFLDITERKQAMEALQRSE